MQAQAQAQAQTQPPQALELSLDNVAQVLSEFVRSDYARQCFNHVNAQPTDYGQIDGMFESVELLNTRLNIKLRQSFGERNNALLERISLYLRARIPRPRLEIHALHRDGMDIW